MDHGKVTAVDLQDLHTLAVHGGFLESEFACLSIRQYLIDCAGAERYRLARRIGPIGLLPEDKPVTRGVRIEFGERNQRKG